MSLTARSPTLLVDILENQLPESSDTKKQHAISQPIPPPLRPGRIPQVDEAVSELAFARSSCQENEPRADRTSHAQSTWNGEVTNINQ
jgi:hypothetical protein